MTKEEFQKKLGAKITFYRKKAKMKQVDLALRCDMEKQNLNPIEKGKINPSSYLMHRIATELNVTLSELFDFS